MKTEDNKKIAIVCNLKQSFERAQLDYKKAHGTNDKLVHVMDIRSTDGLEFEKYVRIQDEGIHSLSYRRDEVVEYFQEKGIPRVQYLDLVARERK